MRGRGALLDQVPVGRGGLLPGCHPAPGPYTGHGSFIAGLIRQVVPDATVLSIRIMHGDGIVYEGDLLYALRPDQRTGSRPPTGTATPR